MVFSESFLVAATGANDGNIDVANLRSLAEEHAGGSEVRDTLTAMSEAAAAIGTALTGDSDPFSPVVVDDARKSGAAIALVLAQEAISSELVDNLNASIHLRALLTDLFLLSETLS